MDEIYINSIKKYFSDYEWDMMNDVEQFKEHDKYCKYKEKLRQGIECEPPDYIQKYEKRKEEIDQQKERDRETRLKRLQNQLIIDATFKPANTAEDIMAVSTVFSDSSAGAPMRNGVSARQRTNAMGKFTKKRGTIIIERNSTKHGSEVNHIVEKMMEEMDLDIVIKEIDDKDVVSDKPAMSLLIHRGSDVGRPLRKLPQVNYAEEREPDDDEMLWCEECQKEYFPQCPSHLPMTHIADKQIPEDIKDITRAERTAPENYVKIAESRIPNAGRGAFSVSVIPKGYRFGPYGGDHTKHSGTAGYCWRIHGNNRRPTRFVDAKDPGISNWMRFVNCARHSSEQNMVAFQYLGEIYYRTCVDIPEDTELLVWYGNEFGGEMNINYKQFHQSLKEPLIYVDTDITHCKYCDICFTTNEFYVKHLKFCRLKKEYDNEHYDETKVKSIDDVDVTVVRQRKKIDEKKSTDAVLSVVLNDECVDKNALTVVKDVSRNVKVNKCGVCEYVTKYSNHLKSHIRIHTGEKPFKCLQCPYRSTRKQRIDHHVRSVHYKIKNFTCFHCNSKFDTKSHLKEHMLIHTNTHKYKCNQCVYKSKRKGNLTKHIKQVHERVKVYKCTECSYSCALKGTLTIHKRIHTGEKAYVCHLCGYKTNQSGNLQSHLKVHLNLKEFHCDLCPYRSNTKNSLYLHKKRCHK